MTAALHVSNGDATDLPGTGLARHLLYWRDVLHEGPVPAVGPEELRQIRADFLARMTAARARAAARHPGLGRVPRTDSRRPWRHSRHPLG